MRPRREHGRRQPVYHRRSGPAGACRRSRVPSSVSIGVAVGPSHGEGASELLRHANAHWHRAKAGAATWRRCVRRLRCVGSSTTGRQRTGAAPRPWTTRHRGLLPAEIDATHRPRGGRELLAGWDHRDGRSPARWLIAFFGRQAGLLERLPITSCQQARRPDPSLSMLGLPEGFRFRVNLHTRPPTILARENLAGQS